MNIRKIAIGVSLLGFATISQASTFTFSGNIANHNDIVRVDFSLANNATNVRVWTDSFLSGTNFDPITALWNADTGARLGENDDNSSIALGQTYFDSGFSLASLAAGNYFFTMATFANFANGTNFLSGILQVTVWYGQSENRSHSVLYHHKHHGCVFVYRSE